MKGEVLNVEGMTYEKALKSFYRRCVSKNLSNKTISFYDSFLLPFGIYVVGKGLSKVNDIDEEIIETYMERFALEHSPITCVGNYASLRVFFRFLHKQEYISVYPMKHLHKPKVPKRHARTFTAEEISIILKQPNKDSFCGFRDYVMLCVLLGTGCRRAELIGMNLLDIHNDYNFISIVGKGDKQRNVPVGSQLKRLLRQYVKQREKHMQEVDAFSPALWVTQQGRPLRDSTLSNLFKRIKRDCNIPSKRLSPHTFRHTYAKSFLLNGGDVFSLQRILGHEDITTTQVYIGYNDRELGIQNDKYNPLDNTRWQYY